VSERSANKGALSARDPPHKCNARVPFRDRTRPQHSKMNSLFAWFTGTPRRTDDEPTADELITDEIDSNEEYDTPEMLEVRQGEIKK
jgi:hypothetical protein